MELVNTGRSSSAHSALTAGDLDRILTAQIIVAWAGEGGEAAQRLGWWQSQMVVEFGGQDLFMRLLPRTWRWAILQTAREAARLRDLELRRAHSADPDALLSLFHLGAEVDELLHERLLDHKQSERAPHVVLPELEGLLMEGGELIEAWSAPRFWEWAQRHPRVEAQITPAGRQLKWDGGADRAQLVPRLVAALWPAPENGKYPLPHVKVR